MKSSKSVMLALVLMAVSASFSQAQLVLSNFSDYVNDADNFTAGPGASFFDAGWSATQGSGVLNFTGADSLGEEIGWDFGSNTTTNAFSSYTQVSLTATATGTFSALRLDFYDAGYGSSVANVSWTAAELQGLPVIKSISLPAGIGGFGFKFIGAPGDLASGSLDNLVLIPEPSTYALLALGLGAILFVRRRTAKA